MNKEELKARVLVKAQEEYNRTALYHDRQYAAGIKEGLRFVLITLDELLEDDK